MSRSKHTDRWQEAFQAPPRATNPTVTDRLTDVDPRPNVDGWIDELIEEAPEEVLGLRGDIASPYYDKRYSPVEALEDLEDNMEQYGGFIGL